MKEKAVRKQGDLFYSGRSSYFHFFNSVIDCGDLAEMNRRCSAVSSVLLIIKSHINYSEGISFPSVRRIAEKSGCSQTSVIKSLRVLVEYGYLEVKTEGRKNIYRAIEKFKLEDVETGEVKEATFPYVPAMVREFREALQKFISTKDDSGGMIRIEGDIIFNIGGTHLSANNLNLNNFIAAEDKDADDLLAVSIEETGKVAGRLTKAVEEERQRVRDGKKKQG